MSKVGSNYICSAVILIDFVIKRNENYKCFEKNINTLKKKKQVIRLIIDDLETFYDDSEE